MLRFLLLLTLVSVVIHLSGRILFSRAPLLNKLKRIPMQTAVLAILALATINAFRGEPQETDKQASATNPVPEVETTAAIATPVVVEPLQPKEAAVACVEQALSEARATDDLVGQTWLSAVEGFLESAPGEVTVQFAVGPRVGPAKGPQSRSEARLTCAVAGRDVKPVTPVHMTGAQIACGAEGSL